MTQRIKNELPLFQKSLIITKSENILLIYKGQVEWKIKKIAAGRA